MNSLRATVLLAYIAGAMLSVVLLVLGISVVMESLGGLLFRRDVASRAQDLAQQLQFDRAGVPVGFDDSEGNLASWLYDSLDTETTYRVLDTSGHVVLSPTGEVASSPLGGRWPAAGRERFEFEREGVLMLGATEPVTHDGRTWFLQFAVSERFMELLYRFALPFMTLGFMLFGLTLLLVFGAGAYLVLTIALRPLERISASAASISTRALDARLDVAGVPEEIAPLVESFNRGLERLESGFRLQQEFLATAAHELKTPLALLRAQIEVIEDGSQRAALLGDVGHMGRQVQQLLHLAEASEVRSYRFSMVDVADVAREAARYLRRGSPGAGVQVTVSSKPSDVHWRADRGALFSLLKNLLENAMEHAPEGTQVCVDVGLDSLSVRDLGPGVSEEQLAQIFSRFWRAPHRRDHGAGLGLAICQEIAVAHGWALSAHNQAPGLRVSLFNCRDDRPPQGSRDAPDECRLPHP
jgi:signal transduction histidine kinase